MYLNRKAPLPRHTLGPCQRKAVQGLSDYKLPDTLLSNSQHNRVKQVTLKWSGTDGEKYGWAKAWPKSGKTCGNSLRYLAVVSYAYEVLSCRYKGAREGGEEREGGERDFWVWTTLWHRRKICGPSKVCSILNQFTSLVMKALKHSPRARSVGTV